MPKIIKIIMYSFLIIMLAYSVLSISFIENPQINNETQSSEDVLCLWNASQDVSLINVTWYNGTTPLFYHNDVNISDSLDKSNTKRGETWVCQVMISNSTEEIFANASIEIKNSDPENFKIYNQSNDENLGSFVNISENSEYIFYLNATDYDGDDVLFGWSLFNPIPAGSQLVHNTGIFTWRPDNETSAGYHNVTFQVEEVYGGIDSLLFLIYVISVNDFPVFSPNLTDQYAYESSYFEYEITAIDEESDYPLNFTIIDTGNISSSMDSDLISNNTFMINFTPGYSDIGVHNISINVSDTQGGFTIGQFSLTIYSINHAPNITYMQNVSGIQNSQFVMHVNASDIDINDTLNFSISANNCSYANPWTINTLDSSFNNSVGLINLTIANEHVVCNNVRIIIFDNKTTAYRNVTINITNVNDMPVIYENSSYQVNKFNNKNIYDLIGYTNSDFSYRLNFTDIDILTYESEIFLVTTNFTDFDIGLNNLTGLISFVPNMTGYYHIMMNVSDDDGLWTDVTLQLNISLNNVPNIENISDMIINESEYFNYTVNASDIDGNDINLSLIFVIGENIFAINKDTGKINFTPGQEDIGNYTINITVTDEHGAYDYSVFNLEIINKPDNPLLDNISFPAMVVNHSFSYNVTANDKDLELVGSTENLTFWLNFINSTTGLIDFINITKLNSTDWLLSYMPNSSMIGNYSIIISVNDTTGLSDNLTYNFTIHNVSLPPEIINITPYGPQPTKFGWANASDFSGKYTIINATENKSIAFNHSTYNPESNETLTYQWYLNGTLVNTTYSYENYFNFQSSGMRNITLVVDDGLYGSDYFSWIINVSNVNRPIVFTGINPDDEDINGTLEDVGYFIGVFYDPDEDINNNGVLDANEFGSINIIDNYELGITNAVEISVNGVNILFKALETGSVEYSFTADDGYTNATTGNVVLDLSALDVGEIEVPVVITRTKTKNMYYQVEVDKIINFDIIVPKTVTMYENNTVIIPVMIKNTGNYTLNGISLSSSSDNDELNMKFEKSFIEYLFVNKEMTTNLLIESYRTQGSYEVLIMANVTDPAFSDKAMVLVNSIEKEREEESKKVTMTKIAFAKDMLSSNVKCLELNEILESAKEDFESGNYDNAKIKIDEVVNACRYLISQKELTEQNPSFINVNINKIRNNSKLLSIFSIIGFLTIFSIGFSIYYTNKK